MAHYSHFDARGQQLGALFTLAPTVGVGLNTAGAVITGIGAGLLDYLKTREQRKLEEEYLKRQQTPPYSMLTPGTPTAYTEPGLQGSNPLPWIIAGAALLFLLSSRGRK